MDLPFLVPGDATTMLSQATYGYHSATPVKARRKPVPSERTSEVAVCLPPVPTESTSEVVVCLPPAPETSSSESEGGSPVTQEHTKYVALPYTDEDDQKLPSKPITLTQKSSPFLGA